MPGAKSVNLKENLHDNNRIVMNNHDNLIRPAHKLIIMKRLTSLFEKLGRGDMILYKAMLRLFCEIVKL